MIEHSRLLLQSDPRASYLEHREAIDAAIQQVLERGIYILGPEVEAFEREFAGFLGVKHAVGVASGTDAIELGLRCCGVGSGDYVVTVGNTASATATAIARTGARMVLAEVDPDTYNMDPSSLEDTLSDLSSLPIKAIVPVALYGHPANMEAIRQVAAKRGLLVIEDCAQAHGAKANGVTSGTSAQAGAFSFYPTKNLGAFGDAGALVTNDDFLMARAREIREYGWRERYVSDFLGMNTRLDTLQAAVLRVKLIHLTEDNERRRRVATIYNQRLGQSCDRLILPQVAPGAYHVYHQYVIRVPQRDKLRDFLKQQGIGTLVHYPVPIHLQGAFRGIVTLPTGGLPLTEQLCNDIVSLPLYPQLTDSDVERVCDQIGQFINLEPH